jgi:hypothetical protein
MGVKLEKVIQIIHEGVPEIRDVSEEHGIVHHFNNMLCRAPSRLNSRFYHHMSSPSYTISFFGHCDSQCRNGIELVKARVPVDDHPPGMIRTKRTSSLIQRLNLGTLNC